MGVFRDAESMDYNQGTYSRGDIVFDNTTRPLFFPSDYNYSSLNENQIVVDY